MGGSLLASRQKMHTRGACKGAEQSCQLEHYKTKFQPGHSVSSRLELATQSSREAKSPTSLVLKKLTFHIPHIPYYKYPHSHEMWCDYSAPLHAPRVCTFWRLASCEPPARSNRESLLHCTVLSIFSHSLTHYPYMIPT